MLTENIALRAQYFGKTRKIPQSGLTFFHHDELIYMAVPSVWRLLAPKTGGGGVTDYLLLAFGVFLTVGTAFFVAAEFSLVTLDPTAVDREIEQGRRGARGVGKALRSLSTELSGAQVGITVTTILLGYTSQPAIGRLLSSVLGDMGVAEAAALPLAVGLAAIVVNGFSMLFGELVPKNLALSTPMATAIVVTPVQRGFTAALRPVILALNSTANAILHRFGVELREELSGARSAQELSALVKRSAQEGTLDKNTASLLTRTIALGDLSAGDVMTDRMRMRVIERDKTAADVVALAQESGHSRFPVISDSRDDVVGLVHLRRAIAVPYERRSEVPVTALSVDAPRVPETIRLAPLLVELRGLGLQMAVVVDEYGGTAGVVTLEDVVEEIVGEVADEHDRRRGDVLRTADGSWSVPGLLRPDELREATELMVPSAPTYETLGGLVMAELGRVPRSGDAIQVGEVLLTVGRMEGRRIDRLRIRSVDRGGEEDA